MNSNVNIYMTKGVSILDKDVLNFLVTLYFNKKEELQNNLDYFLVYTIEKKSEDLFIIKHSQENVDENIQGFQDIYYINTVGQNLNIDKDIKIYSVLEDNNLTFMLSEEY